MSDALNRVVAELDAPDLVERLAGRVPASDLTTLLLEVMHRRSGRIAASELLERYQHDRFVVPGPDFRALRRVESTLIEHIADSFEWVTLAPVVPLGTHSSMGFVHQNNVVATIRSTEVAADPTNGLALEAAVRRRALIAREPKSADRVDLAAVQRVLRAQVFSGAMSFAHFTILGLVSAGRDAGGARFESEAVSSHIAGYAAGLTALGADRIRVVATRWNPDVIIAVPSGVDLEEDPERQAGYYRDVAFKILVTVDGTEVEIGDGGAVDWTQRLCHSAKERLVISGLGLDRLALIR